MAFENCELWWITGAQLLYGGDAVVKVDAHSKEMVDGLNASGNIPVRIVYKGTANSSKEVEDVMLAANNDSKCVGVITWMHTFSPAKMWIKGLQDLKKPLLHFHTQYNAEIPWNEIDMDFMNLNQSAHGDIEFGHICSRMRVPRKVVVGYWKDPEAQRRIAIWARVSAALADARNVLCLMFGMNMNNVAVTDGDRVEFEQRLGYHVDYYPVSSLMDYWKKVSPEEVDALVEEYKSLYTIKIDETGPEVYWKKVRNAARAEIAIRRVLKDKGATAFTTNFDDLGDADIESPSFCGFDQIPGLATQRLMAEGYGFGAEGDWKTACLQRTLWVMSQGLPGGCSFLEDYTLSALPGHRHPQAAHRPPGVHLQDRPRLQGYHRRPRKPLPRHRTGCRLHRAPAYAQTARGIGPLGSPSQLRSGRLRLDPCRRYPPFGLQLRHHGRILGRLRGDYRHRVPPHRRPYHHPPVQERTAHERGLLSAEQISPVV